MIDVGLYCVECGLRSGDIADTSAGPVPCADVVRCPGCGWGVCELCAARDHECVIWSADDIGALDERHREDIHEDRRGDRR